MASRNRGKIKIKLRDLARLKPTEEEEEAQRQQLIGANIPTVVAILGASLIENMLDELLTSHFSRRDEVTWGLLTGDGGPLGSFSNKILAAYAFGIITDVIKSNIDTVRHIRNAFAHTMAPLTFSHAAIVTSLEKSPLPNGKRTQLYKRLSSVREIAPESPQDAFIILCLQIQLELGKKLAGRERAKNKRLSKRYGTRLSGGLFNFLSGDQQAEIASEPASQNALRALLFPEGPRK